MFIVGHRAQEAAGRQRSLSFDQVIAALDSSQSAATASGATITTQTAMRQITVWSCVRILAESIGQLPILTQERQGDRWVAVEHDILGVLREPNDWMTQHDLLSFLVSWTELRGNAYLIKNTGVRGAVKRLFPVPADEVNVKQADDWSLTYTVNGDRSRNGPDYKPDKIVHVRNFGTDGFLGLSTIANCAEAVGLALKTEEHGARLFKNGAKVGQSLEIPGGLDEEQYERLERRLREQFSGTANAHKTLIIEGGGTLKPIGMTAEDSQFLETRRFQKQEIASLFGVPLFLLNDTEKATTWGTGLEQISQAFVRYTLAPRLSRISSTLARQLLNPEERQKIRFVFDTDAFTMGDFKQRMEGYRVAVEGGILNPNECRELEGRNPRDGGDEYRESVQVQPQEEDPTANPEAAPEPVEGEDDEQEERRQIFNITLPEVSVKAPLTMPNINVNIDESGDYVREVIEYDERGFPVATVDKDYSGIVRRERRVLEYDSDGNPKTVQDRRIK